MSGSRMFLPGMEGLAEPADPQEGARHSLPGTALEFILKRDRFQSLRLSVLLGRLPLVKAPAGEPMESIHAFVRSHLEGILKAQRRRHAPEKKERPGSPAQPSVMILPGTDLEFTLVRDAHKTLRLSVRQGGLIMVKSPASVSLDSICGFVRSHLGWIEKKRGGMASRKTSPASFRDGGTVWIQGKARVIKIIPPRAAPRLEEGSLLLPCSPEGSAPDGIETSVRKAYLAWRQDYARKYLEERLDSLAERAREMLDDGLSPSSLSVRPLRGRWGSCGRDGKITLAAALVELPDPLIDHVICHELCHLRAMDHGKSFHALLEHLTPGERDLRRRIREWSAEHPRVERDRPL